MRFASSIVLMMCFACAAAAPSAQAAPVIKVVRPSADASVRVDHPTRTSGAAKTLRVDGYRAARAYLRFRVRGLAGQVVGAASLWVWQPERGPFAGLTAHGTSGRSWSERTLAWSRRPAVRPAAGMAAGGPGRWRRLDVTPLVRADGTVDIALTTTRRTGVLLSSRESGRTRAPRLHLRVERDVQPAFPIQTAVFETNLPAR